MKDENTPTIKTSQLILRKFTKADIKHILQIYGDEDVNRFLPWFPIKTIEAAEKYFYESISPEYDKGIAYRYAVALKNDNIPIGYVNVSDIGGSNDIGYGLRKEFWHNGIITEACSAVVGRLRETGLSYITATHDVNNPHSGAVMRKIGMTYRYSYEELWQPKGFMVTFRMYQLNFDNSEWIYEEYRKKYSSFIEDIN